MRWRTVVVRDRSKLEMKNNYLVIRNDKVVRVFLDEISILIVENTGSAITVSLLEALWNRKIAVIFCDRYRYPGFQLIPYYNSYELWRCVILNRSKVSCQRKPSRGSLWRCVILNRSRAVSNQLHCRPKGNNIG